MAVKDRHLDQVDTKRSANGLLDPLEPRSGKVLRKYSTGLPRSFASTRYACPPGRRKVQTVRGKGPCSRGYLPIVPVRDGLWADWQFPASTRPADSPCIRCLGESVPFTYPHVE